MAKRLMPDLSPNEQVFHSGKNPPEQSRDGCSTSMVVLGGKLLLMPESSDCKNVNLIRKIHFCHLKLGECV